MANMGINPGGNDPPYLFRLPVGLTVSSFAITMKSQTGAEQDYPRNIGHRSQRDFGPSKQRPQNTASNQDTPLDDSPDQRGKKQISVPNAFPHFIHTSKRSSQHIRENKSIDDHLAGLCGKNLNKRAFLRSFIKSLLQAHQVFIDFHDELTVMYYSDPEIRKLTETYDRNIIQFILEYLKQAQNQLRVLDLEAAAPVIYWTVHSVVDAIFLSEEDDCKQRAIDQLVDMMATYLFGDNEES
jgi:hypothetical protein